MRANIRRNLNGQETGDFVPFPGEHTTLTNLVCYGVIPYARLKWDAQAGDKISVHVYSNPDLTRTGEPDKKIVVTLEAPPTGPTDESALQT